MAARLGVRRALVEFVAPIVPMFLRAGDALFLATVAVFVADLTGHPLAAADIALLCLLAPLGAMLAIGGTGIAALALGAGVLVHLDLPILWVLPILVLIDSATAGLRSTVSTLVACAVMAMVSRGLTLETQTLDDDGSADRARFVLSTMQIAMVLALLAVAMGLVLLAGIGVGMRA
jgi:Na+/H+-dicarboxylate symporter